MAQPDFDQMARNINVPDDMDGEADIAAREKWIADQFRQVWNARGAAMIDPVTNAVDDWVRAGAGTYDELQAIVEHAITKLDR